MSLTFLVLAIFLAGFGVLGLYLVSRKRWTTLAAIVALIVVGVGLAFRPVFVPIAAADPANFNPPIDQRDAANFYGLRYFRQIGGDWHHCKTWLARQFFF